MRKGLIFLKDYPRLVINKEKLTENVNYILKQCDQRGISVSGVVKGFNGLSELVWLYDNLEFDCIADSRIDRLKQYKQMGVKKPLMLLRVPQLCELSDVSKYCDISLNSEYTTISKINEHCKALGNKHGVLLMLDLGDLREGIVDENEAVETAVKIEKELENIELKGVGTNLGCYGAIKPSEQNLGKLVKIAREIEQKIGRPLEILSGGATTSLPLMLDGKMPDGINNLRIGEAILNAYDLDKLWNYPIPELHQDAFTLETQVVEVRTKPSYPMGELFVDAFGNIPVFEDKGLRKKAIVALGKLDMGLPGDLLPALEGVTVLGASSDHTILDIEECKEKIEVGSIVKFNVKYIGMLYASSSFTVKKIFV